MTDPQPLAAGFAALAESFPPEHRLHKYALDVIAATSECAERKTRLLKYPDLAEKLTEAPLKYARPEQWNGWVPPRLTDPGSQGESLLQPHLDGGGGFRYRFNQLGKRTIGEQVNDSPRRTALVAVCAEAWQREQDVLAAAGTRQEGTP